MEHDARYDRADEFMEVVLGHWNTWEDDALILDKETSRFADPEKVHRLDHDGKYFRSRGPFSVPRSPQGQPVLIQAGQSGRGLAFAAKWAEMVFVIYHGLEHAKEQYALFKEAVAAEGRDPASVSVAPACYVCVGESEAAAQEKRAVVEATAREVDALVLLSEVLNYDFAAKSLDEPFSDEELAELSFQGFRDRVIRYSGKKNPTVRDFITVSGRGTVKEHVMFCGNPKQVADQMEEWFTAPACDGFVLAATNMPGSYDDVVRLLVPELQRRGLFQKEYAGPTLAGKSRPADPPRRRLAREAPEVLTASTPIASGLRQDSICSKSAARIRAQVEPERSAAAMHQASSSASEACARSGVCPPPR